MENVLLITVDSLRADRCSWHGYDRDTSPNLDGLEAKSISYMAATTHGPTTFTSFPSIFTESHALESPEYPKLHGRTLAERLSKVGYHTLSVTSNAWVSPTYGYDRGFDEVHALGRGPRSATSRWERIRHRIGQVLGDGVIFRMLKRIYDSTRSISSKYNTEEERIHDIAVGHLKRPEPTFTWVHYMTTHTPYEPDLKKGPIFRDSIPGPEKVRELTERARENPNELTGSERRVLSDLYDESVRHVDRRIGALLETVDLSDTVVAVTADHGEELWDHDGFEHPPKLYQELLHVPLIISTPSEKTMSVKEPVGLDALGPTLLATATDLTIDQATLPPWGPDYGPVVSACAHPNRFDSATADSDYLQVAVREGRYKYVRKPDSEEDLYDLETDPGERVDRKDAKPHIVSELAPLATDAEATYQFAGDGEIPPELEDQLSNLGYLK